MRESSLRSSARSVIAKLALGAAFLCGANVADSDPSIAAANDWIGPYSIGHTTLVIIDPSRNPDGSTPVTSSGRPLYLHIWYPTKVRTSQHITYTWNNPVYNQNTAVRCIPACPIYRR